MDSWILPIDTLDSTFRYAYADLMHLRWNLTVGGRPPGGEGAGSTSEIVQQLGGLDRVLDEPEQLQKFFYERFAADGVHGVLNPFATPGLSVLRVPALAATYAVTDRGLLLPAFGEAPPPASQDAPDGPDDDALADALRALGAPAPRWIVRGTQLDLLRTAASQAIVALWRSPDFGLAGQASFKDVLLSCYRTQADVLAALGRPVPPFPAEHLTVSPISSVQSDAHATSYFNPQDGAGYFTPEGYTVFGPPPPPVYDAYVSPASDTWAQTMPLNCGLYAPRYALDCTTCCPDRPRAFYEPSRRRDDRPPSAS